MLNNLSKSNISTQLGFLFNTLGQTRKAANIFQPAIEANNHKKDKSHNIWENISQMSRKGS
uniref:Uncharacterized protein n=1 Tax=Cucumis melo subsp. melo TaxID=412675 RepID=E5GCC8_CUCME|nr:hypothetical protein [Cucumis melo subsp. melo]